MENLRKYTQKSELYKLSAEEQTEKMQLVMQEVQKISSYTGVSEDAAYKLFLNGYSVPNELAGQQIAFSEDELTVDLLNSLAENKVRSIRYKPPCQNGIKTPMRCELMGVLLC